METKFVTRRSFSAAPCIKVPPPHSEVTKGTARPHRGSRVIFLDENGNEITDESKEFRQEQNEKISKEGLPRGGNALLVRRRSCSLDAARFTAWYNNRRNSNLWRDQFLQSFGKTTIRYPNLDEEDIKENTTYLNVPMMDSIAQAETPIDYSLEFKRRTQSAGPVLLRPSSRTKNAVAHEHLLELRGSEYTGDPPELDLKAKIRKQSAKRRIKRIMEAEKEKAEQERLAMEEEQKLKEKENKKRPRLRSATFAVMAMNVSAAGFSFKSFTEKKKWLAEKRLWTKQMVSTNLSVYYFVHAGAYPLRSFLVPAGHTVSSSLICPSCFVSFPSLPSFLPSLLPSFLPSFLLSFTYCLPVLAGIVQTLYANYCRLVSAFPGPPSPLEAVLVVFSFFMTSVAP